MCSLSRGQKPKAFHGSRCRAQGPGFGLVQISIRGQRMTIEAKVQRTNVHEQQFAA